MNGFDQNELESFAGMIVNPVLYFVPLCGRNVAFTAERMEDNKCLFLRHDFKCNIYENRPDVCRKFGYTPKDVFNFLDKVFLNATILRIGRGSGLFVIADGKETDKASIVRFEQVADRILCDLLTGVNPQRQAEKYQEESTIVDMIAERITGPAAKSFTPEQYETLNAFVSDRQSPAERKAIFDDLSNKAIESLERYNKSWADDVHEELDNFSNGITRENSFGWHR